MPGKIYICMGRRTILIATHSILLVYGAISVPEAPSAKACWRLWDPSTVHLLDFLKLEVLHLAAPRNRKQGNQSSRI